MAANAQTYSLWHDFSKGHFLGASGLLTGYLSKLPDPLWASNSFDLEILCYEKYSATSPVHSDFGVGATVQLYAVLANAGLTPGTLVATGSAVQSDAAEYDLLQITVDKEDIPDALVGPDRVLLYVQVTFTEGGANRERTVGQILNLTDERGDGSGTATAAYDIPYTPDDSDQWETAPDDVAEGLDYLALRARVRAVAVDATAVAGSTTVYTVPTGYYAIPVAGFFHCTGIVADGVAQTAKWQADSTDLCVAALSRNAADNDVDAAVFVQRPDLNPPRDVAFPAGTVFKYTTTVASTNSTHDGLAVLDLILYETE